MRHLHQPLGESERDPPGAIGDNQRTIRDRGLECSRAALAQCGVGSSQNAERSRVNEAERAAIRVERNGRRYAHNDLQARDSALQLPAGGDESIDMAIDLLLSASGKKRKDRRVLGKPEGFARLQFAWHVHRAIEHRMADERRIDAESAQQRFLERKDHRRLCHEFGQLRYSTGAPRPHLRRHVVQDGHAWSLRGRGELHVEAGIIDQNEESDFTAVEHFPDSPQQDEVPGNVLQNLEKPHHAELAVPVNQLDALLRQAWTTDGGETQLGSNASQRRRNAGSMKVAGGLSSDEQHLTHDGARSRPGKEV